MKEMWVFGGIVMKRCEQEGKQSNRKTDDSRNHNITSSRNPNSRIRVSIPITVSVEISPLLSDKGGHWYRVIALVFI